MEPPVRVALDVQALQVPGFADRGIGRYVTGYARALAERRLLAAALVAPELAPPSGLPEELTGGGLVRWDSQSTCRDLLGTVGPPVVYHLTAPFLHTAPADPPALGIAEHWARAGCARVVLLHDLIPLRAPHAYLPSPAHEDRYRSRARWVAGADLILANSDYTRREAVEVLGADPASVVTVGAGVSRYFSPSDGTDEALWRYHLGDLGGRPYVLTVGGSDVRKGIDRAIAALARVVARGVDVALVVVGHLTDQWRSDLRATSRACGVADRVLLLGAVNDEVLRACYRRAVLTIMPSLAEGAGLPVLESAACGTPALASGTTALAETAGTPEASFDPGDTDAVADAVAVALLDDERRARILAVQRATAAASTWEAVASRAERALRQLSGGPHPEGWSAPPRVALVAWPGPDAELDSVVAELSASGRAEITCVGRRPPGAGGAVHAVSLPAFGPDVRPASFDSVVYRLGPLGGEALLALARRYPGWLWVGDPAVLPAATRLAGGCRGFLVGSAAAARALQACLPALRAHPPIVVGAGDEPAEAVYRAVGAGSVDRSPGPIRLTSDGRSPS